PRATFAPHVSQLFLCVLLVLAPHRRRRGKRIAERARTESQDRRATPGGFFSPAVSSSPTYRGALSMTTQAASDEWYARTEKTSRTDDERIRNVMPLPPPEHLIRFFPIQGTPV